MRYSFRWLAASRLAMPLFLVVLCIASLVASPAAAQRHHTVRAGQSMSRIARRYRIDVWDLALANRMRPSQMLRPGQILTVPPRGVTYVRPGQTLSHIARDHDCSVDELRRLNRMRRGRTRLRAGQRLILPGYAPAEATAPQDWGTSENPGRVTFVRRGERVTVQLVDAEGRVTRAGLEGLAQLMRRHENDEPQIPHPRLVRLLASIADHFGGREITLVSGRREAGGYTRESSRHTSGHATDIRVRDVPRRQLWDYCRSLHLTGCGFYPRSTFVHVDVRRHSAQWVDWSSPGRRPRYGNLSRPWPRMCRNPRRRRHRRCSREGRRVTRRDEVPELVQLSPDALEILAEVPAIGDDPAHVDEYETAAEDHEVDPGEDPQPEPVPVRNWLGRPGWLDAA